MIDNLTRPFRGKTVDDIYINISHFLDHFIMLIFAKAAYDGSALHSAMMKLSFTELLDLSFLADGPHRGPTRRPILAITDDGNFHFGIGFGAIMAGISQALVSLSLPLV